MEGTMSCMAKTPPCCCCCCCCWSVKKRWPDERMELVPLLSPASGDVSVDEVVVDTWWCCCALGTGRGSGRREDDGITPARRRDAVPTRVSDAADLDLDLDLDLGLDLGLDLDLDLDLDLETWRRLRFPPGTGVAHWHGAQPPTLRVVS